MRMDICTINSDTIPADTGDCIASTGTRPIRRSKQSIAEDRRVKHRPPALQGFRHKARIDWIRFIVRLEHPSQFRHLRNRAEEVWGNMRINPVRGDESSTLFEFQLHNPPGPDQFMADLQCIRRDAEPLITEDQVTITGIEVAMDGRIEGSDYLALAVAVEHLLRHQANPPSGPPRITTQGYKAIVPISSREVLSALMGKKSSINCGARNAHRRSRFYVKFYDTVDDTAYKTLPPDEWRARFENTYEGSMLPFQTIAGWRSCRFEKVLSNDFALVTPDVRSTHFGALVQERMIQLGRRSDSPRLRPSDRKKSAPFTHRDTVINDEFRQALRALTKTQSCQNSVKKSCLKPVLSLGGSGLDGQSPLHVLKGKQVFAGVGVLDETLHSQRIDFSEDNTGHVLLNTASVTDELDDLLKKLTKAPTEQP